jgi:hypothetical protein
MREVKDGLPTPSGESEESEDLRWTRAVGSPLARSHGRRKMCIVKVRTYLKIEK